MPLDGLGKHYLKVWGQARFLYGIIMKKIHVNNLKVSKIQSQVNEDCMS